MSSLEGVEWAAQRLGEKPQFVYTLVRQGLLPAVHLGRKVKFDPEVIEAWCKAGGAALRNGKAKECDADGP